MKDKKRGWHQSSSHSDWMEGLLSELLTVDRLLTAAITQLRTPKIHLHGLQNNTLICLKSSALPYKTMLLQLTFPLLPVSSCLSLTQISTQIAASSILFHSNPQISALDSSLSAKALQCSIVSVPASLDSSPHIYSPWQEKALPLSLLMLTSLMFTHCG